MTDGDVDEVSDAALMARSADGDRRAYDLLVMRHAPRALRVAARLLPDLAAAEDVVQEAMVRAWSQAGRFDPERARFTTWLHRIVVNLSIDHRRRLRLESLPEDYDAVDESTGADERLDAECRRVALIGAMRSLPPRHRAVMTLVYDEGLSGAETARVIGSSAKAVERLLARARAMLRERLLPQIDA